MKKTFNILWVCFLYLGICTLAYAQVAAEKNAIEAARGWLEIVDDQDYAESWKRAAKYFRKTVTKKQWRQALTAARSPLGKVISRSLKSAQYTTALPGAPDGEYVVIQFETTFEKKTNSLETITPLREKDGNWRVAGYYIK